MKPKHTHAAALLIAALLATGCDQQPSAAVKPQACGQQVSGASDDGQLQLSGVWFGPGNTLKLGYRGHTPAGHLNAYLTKNGTVVGHATRAPGNGTGLVDTFCPGTTWNDITKAHIFDYQVTLTLDSDKTTQTLLLAAQPVFAHAD
ncbi:hypothetical protein ACFYNO_33250 [Kitasatospora sp. NPDC006697]|uniref:hypothetical protein n=1 Tax=Kitasatospora sp. NPDC006697 TaxID=3364020 RepID=UPI0036B27967